MILALDIGNTNIVLGCVDHNRNVEALFRIKTDISRTSWQYAVEINSMLSLNNIDKDRLNGSIISSVVPPLTSVMQEAVKITAGLDTMVVGPGVKTGLNIALDNPKQVGSDLVVDAVATIQQYKLPAIVFDMGTATTVSVIDKSKTYIGGMIIPGIMVCQESLTARTSQLPKISLEPPKKIIGTNTVDCMKSGAVYGSAAMVDGIIDSIEQELGERTTVIATGGIAPSIMLYCKHKNIIIDNDLLLKGLRIIYDKNK